MATPVSSSMLKSIAPADVNRFASPNPVQVHNCKESSSISKTSPIIRPTSATPAKSHTEPTGTVKHPEGSLFFYWGIIVSNQNITEQHTTLARYILDQCDAAVTTASVTIFIEILGHGGPANYYVIVHDSKIITWIVDQAPESYKSATQAKHEHEYWVHMENFPGPHFSAPSDLWLLKSVLASNAIDALTSDGSTSPMSVAQIKTHLVLLDSFSGEGDVYQTYAIARLWNLILQSRVINKFGTPAARLDRFISISDNPPGFAGTYAPVVKFMFNHPYVHFGRCSKAWADRIAYTEEWRKFRATNEKEWKQVVQLSCVLVIAAVIIGKRSSCIFGIPAYATLLVALASASSGYYLLTESQNLGDHAADASVYFQQREEIIYGVQRLSIINAIPQSLLIWAFVFFVLSVFCV